MSRAVRWLAAVAAVASSSCAACAAAQRPPREVVLRDATLVQSSDGRLLLRYLIGCAMPQDVRVVADHDGEHLSFDGDLNLAPQWVSEPLTRAQQRRLSACILARVNRFGRHVRISLRSSAPDAPERLDATQIGAAERAQYALFEGAFFGNLFDAPAKAYVCVGDVPTYRRAWLEQLTRECTLPTDGDVPAGALSRCRMVIVGACSAANYVQDGEDFSNDAISVYLPAMASDDRGTGRP